MKRPSPKSRIRRTLVLGLLSLIAVAALLTLAASAKRSRSLVPLSAGGVVNPPSANYVPDPALTNAQGKKPLAPQAASIVATLTDNITAATKVAPGGTINYTATITNNGAASPADDATNLNFSAPLDANTTLVGGSIHASPIARNDTYNWVGNTQLDTAARALPAVTANDVAVNAPAGTDTFTVTAIAGGATSLGGTVTLASPSGAFTYTPPVGRPNIADGASANDTFTYTITNNADPSLTSTGTVTITLTGRVWYLQAGAAGDGRSNTPSSSPAAMSTAADKSTDFFYIFSNAGSLNGPFSVDAGQQLLGQGVNLVVSAITLFTAAAPTPTTTNTAGSCVSLAGAPGNNTLSGFNIGNCTGGTAITGANVGTLNVSTLSINTNGGGLDLTGVSTPTVSVVLGGLTSTGGTKNVNLVGLNGTFTLASGALSGATGNAFDVNGGNAGITYSGGISNSGGRQVSIINKTTGTVALSGAVNGTGTGIFINANGTSTINFTGGVVLSTAANAAFTATGGGIVSVTGASNTLTTTTGTALNVANTNIGASGLTFLSISANGATNGIILNTTGGSGGLTVTGTSTTAGTGGTIQNNVQGALFTSTSNLSLSNMNFTNPNSGNGTVNNIDGPTFNNAAQAGINLSSVSTVSFTDLNVNGGGGAGGVQVGINGQTVSDMTIANSTVSGFGDAATEGDVKIFNLTGTCSIANSTFSFAAADASAGEQLIDIRNNTGTLTLTATGNTFNTTRTSANGGTQLMVTGVGTATVNENVFHNSFLATKTSGVETFARDTSTVNVNITDGGIGGNGNVFDRQGGLSRAIGLNDEDTAHLNFNINRNAKIYGSGGPVINIAGINHAVISGRIDNNGDIQGGGVGAVGSPILVQSEDATSLVVDVSGNTITNVGNDPGIFPLLHGDGISLFTATLDINIVNNHVTMVGSNTFGILLSSGASNSDATTLYANLQNNIVTVGGSGNTAFGVENTGGASANVFLQGFTTNGQTTWNNRGNTPLNSYAELINVNEPAAIPAGHNGGTVQTPSNPTAMYRPENNRQYELARTNESAEQFESTMIAANNSPMSSGVNGSSTMLARLKQLLHPVGSFAMKVNFLNGAQGLLSNVAHRIDSMITPTAYAQEPAPNAPTSGENVTLNTIATFPAGGKSITIKYSATVNTPPLARSVQTQGTVTANGGAISVVTDDPEPAGGPQATVTLVDTTMTWNGATSTDWNTATNWTQPAGGTQYAPGVSNPAVNDVVIPNVGNQPNISATDIGIFSLNISNGRTLTITNPRVLTIGGSPGGDLTLDGIISGGNLNLGTGTHVINNAGGTGSLSATNVATVLSGSTVTLNNNLQAGALAVNAGGSMTIANRTLSLNGSGAALVVPAGSTFTTTGSTVIYNGAAAQQAAGIAYNNLTINNTIGAHVTGVTLIGNASVAAVLTLTSSDLATTGAFTLTMPVGATSGPASGATDVVGNVKRTGFVSGGAALSFGNPFNTIRINSGAAPADINILLAKNAPATYAAAVSRSYTITPNGANGPATLRLHYRQVELNGNSETPTGNFNLRKGPSWTAVIPTNRNVGVAEDNWLENNAVASFSEWTFANLAPTAAGGAITGRIVDSNGRPVEGAVVRLSGAQNRKFITDANGNYRFENVETGGFYTVTPSRANYHFNPFNRSFSQTGNQTQAVFTATSMGDNENPLDTAEYFVRQQYVDVLSREPEEAGFNYWSDRILGCAEDAQCVETQRREVAAAFFISEENQASGSYIYDLYSGSLGRRPAFGEFSADRAQVVGGATLDTAKTVFAQNFVQRAEFVTRYQNAMTADAFVEALIESVQSSGVDLSGERSNLIDIYGQAAGNLATNRAAVLRAVADNAVFKQSQYNQAFVLTEYFAYLRRDIDLNGYTFWVQVLNTGDPGNYRGMVCSFVTSAEYQNRFSSVMTHSNGECSR